MLCTKNHLFRCVLNPVSWGVHLKPFIQMCTQNHSLCVYSKPLIPFFTKKNIQLVYSNPFIEVCTYLHPFWCVLKPIHLAGYSTPFIQVCTQASSFSCLLNNSHSIQLCTHSNLNGNKRLSICRIWEVQEFILVFSSQHLLVICAIFVSVSGIARFWNLIHGLRN